MLSIPIIVDLQNLRILHGHQIIFENLNFKLANGEMVYVIGKSGTGKSTFIKTIYGEIPIADGKAVVANQDLSVLNQSNIYKFRRKLGIVFQDFHLLNHWTVTRNLEYVLKALDWKDKKLIKQRVEEVLSQVDMTSKADKIVSHLSGGEQQKIAIARSILNKPQLLLADEPTGNLDPETGNEIMYLLHKVANDNKTAIIIATHDYRLLERFPARVYICKNKNITEENV